jgi:hypothetical protein
LFAYKSTNLQANGLLTEEIIMPNICTKQHPSVSLGNDVISCALIINELVSKKSFYTQKASTVLSVEAFVFTIRKLFVLFVDNLHINIINVNIPISQCKIGLRRITGFDSIASISKISIVLFLLQK